MLKMLDLFSGIGGFSLAAEWTEEIETIAFCERDKFCQKVLNKHWPNVPIVDDIFNLRGDEFGAVDIVSGGFPCQPFSVAGKQKGTRDDRYLWPEMLRVIKNAKPAWVIGENVAGFVSMALEQTCTDLESEGYEVWPIIIPACAVNAPHRRDRVWIIAYSRRNTKRLETVRFASELFFGKEERKRSSERDRLANKNCIIADPRNERLQGHEQQGTFIQKERASRSTAKCTWDENWPEVAARFCRMDDGVSSGLVRPKGWRANALKALGNSIVPQIAYEILNCVVRVNKEKAY